MTSRKESRTGANKNRNCNKISHIYGILYGRFYNNFPGLILPHFHICHFSFSSQFISTIYNTPTFHSFYIDQLATFSFFDRNRWFFVCLCVTSHENIPHWGVSSFILYLNNAFSTRLCIVCWIIRCMYMYFLNYQFLLDMLQFMLNDNVIIITVTPFSTFYHIKWNHYDSVKLTYNAIYNTKAPVGIYIPAMKSKRKTY